MPARAREPLRWLLPLSWPFGLAVRARNLAYDLGLARVRRLPVPVVSIGNLTVGGTGKTQLVAHLVGRCRDAGIRVGVLARGYGRAAGDALNDEGRMLATRFAGLAQAQSPRRHDAGLGLCAVEGGLDLVLLDDGFQHRQLHRDLDLCCVDARLSLAPGHLLPAGWLREPERALARADLVVLTGCEGLDPGELVEARRKVARLHRDTQCPACETLPVELRYLPEGRVAEPAELAGRSLTLLAAIARPERFVRTVGALGARVEERCFLRDHAPIGADRLAALARDAKRAGRLLVLTEKDEARLRLPDGAGPERCVLAVGLRFVGAEPRLERFLPRGFGRRR